MLLPDGDPRGRHHRGGRGARGSRVGVPKPLVPVAGVPLIEHAVSRIFAAAGDRLDRDHLQRRGRGLRRASCADASRDARPKVIVTNDAAPLSRAFARSSALAPGAPARLDRGRVLPARGFRARSPRRRAQAPADATVLAVTPLRRRREAALGRARRGTAASRRSAAPAGDAVTAGIYVFSEQRARGLEPPRGSRPACASSSPGSAKSGSRSGPSTIEKVVDVDRAEDVAARRGAVGSAARPAAGSGR